MNLDITSECGYCGVPLLGRGTKEHIIPKCFKIGPYDLPWPTISACEHCNTKKSRLDDKIRDLFVADIASEANPVARELLNTKALRSFKRSRQRNQSHVFDPLSDSAVRPEVIFDASGVAHQTLQIAVNQDMVRSWFRFIVTGLTLNFYNENVTADIAVDFVRFPPGKSQHSLELLKHCGVVEFVSAGPNTECVCVNLVDLPAKSKFWYFRFYSGLEFFVGVNGGVDGIRQMRGSESSQSDRSNPE